MTDEKFLARQGRRADEVVATRPSPVSPASRHRGAGGTGAGGIERDLPEIDHSTDGAYWGSIARAVANLERQAEGDRGCLLLVTLSSDHPEWPVRAAAVRLLAEHHREQTIALRAIAAAVCDDVDQVAFTAIELAGRHRIRAAVANLIKISGWPSRFTQPGYARKPVGYGAALTKKALLAIFGSADPEALRQLEDEHFAGLRARVAAERRPRRHDDVVVVAAGPFVAGATRRRIGPFQIDDTDNPRRVVDLPAFAIDRIAVTNRRYRRFLEEADGTAEFDHPEQDPGRSHLPAHWHDARFNAPDLPVVGIDWYDAWAFARWAGGSLPSEDQWEKTARGTDGRIFRWGDDWDPTRANYVETAFGRRVANLAELQSLLTTVTRDHTSSPTGTTRSASGASTPSER